MTPRTPTGKFRAIPSRCLDCGRVMRKRGKCPHCDCKPAPPPRQRRFRGL